MTAYRLCVGFRPGAQGNLRLSGHGSCWGQVAVGAVCWFIHPRGPFLSLEDGTPRHARHSGAMPRPTPTSVLFLSHSGSRLFAHLSGALDCDLFGGWKCLLSSQFHCLEQTNQVP